MMLLKYPKRERGYKKERILRALLSGEGSMTKYRVSKEAEVSEPWCREYTSRLEKEELLNNAKIIDYEKVYKEWERVHIEPSSVSVSLQGIMNILRSDELTYVLTTYKAENLHQGFLFPSMIDFYISVEEREKWLEIIEERGVIGGGDVRIRLSDEHVFYRKQMVNGLFTVSIPQLILDLRIEGGPCKEAADKLMERYHGGR